MILFDPAANDIRLQVGYSIRPVEQVEEDESELGSKTAIAVAERSLRVLNLPYRVLSHAGIEYLKGWHDHHRGAARPFLLDLPEPVPTPLLAPDLVAVAGGNQAERTVRVGFSWLTAAGETRLSPVAELLIPEDELAVVTLPAYPPAVSQARIYATQGAAGSEVAQVTLTDNDRDWTQPDAALLTGTAAPSTTNTATERIACKFALQGFEYERDVGPHYRALLRLEEVYS